MQGGKNIFGIEDYKYKTNIRRNEGDYVSYPLNIFNPSTYDKPGHGIENSHDLTKLNQDSIEDKI